VQQIRNLEAVLQKSLLIYDKIVSSTSIEDLDNLMDKEANIIINEFQQLVLEAKNHKILKEETKKEEDKARNSGQLEQKKENKTEEAPRLLDNVLKDVAKTAEKLEDGLNADKFKEGQNKAGTKVETVIKVQGESEKGHFDNSTRPAPNAVLIDSSNNQYVLSKPGDGTAQIEDFKLLNDLLMLLLACFVAVMVMEIVQLPTFFGYILAGIVAAQYNVIQNAVQVETISRGLGVIFIMFFLGLEFNLDKLKRVLAIALFGSLLCLVFTVAICVGIGMWFEAKVPESIVVGASIFLSSTAVVLNLLKPQELDLSYGRSIMGILVAQDVMLGFLLAMMPMLQSSGIELAYTALKLIGNLVFFVFIAYLLSYPCINGLDWLRKTQRNHEIFVMASIAFCLAVVQLGFLLDQSMELSCFVAGMLVASRNPLAGSVIHSLEQLKLVFAALFFASIGLHIYPSFLIKEGLLLLTLTSVVLIAKILLTFVIIVFFFRLKARTALIIGVGLGQISEFTFVLASKAKGYSFPNQEHSCYLVKPFSCC
jgi:Kef-type K+ transport system membrane component KefB